jgi:hypothetical protein
MPEKIVISAVDGKEYIYDYDGQKNDYFWDYPRENLINVFQKGYKVAMFNSRNIVSLQLLKEE